MGMSKEKLLEEYHCFVRMTTKDELDGAAWAHSNMCVTLCHLNLKLQGFA